MSFPDLPLIGLLTGEAAGIGPELVARLLSCPKAAKLARFVVIGDERILRWGCRIARVCLPPYHKVNALRKEDCDAEITLFDLANLDYIKLQLSPGKVDPRAGKAALEAISAALQLAAGKQVDAIVYAPLCKENLVIEGRHFEDEGELFAHLLNWRQSYGAVNFMDGLWFTRVTSHIALKDVGSRINREAVLQKICFTHALLRQAGVEQPKIAVSALNPHAGENGLFGDEEIESIAPAITMARSRGIDVDGPFPADTVFLKMRRRDYHALVSMYHDQSQIGMKLLGFERGVTINGGLPVILTTPAHGTAFDIAGKGEANPQALFEAVRMACRLTGKIRS